MKLIIDATTGTVLEAEHCYVVDTDDLSWEDSETLDNGSDGETSDIAVRVGKSVQAIGQATGWGDNAYAYTVSYSPLSLRDEAEAYLDAKLYSEDDHDSEWNAIVWAKSAPLEDLEEVSAWAMSNESVWYGFRDNFIEALMTVWDRKQKGLDVSN